MQWLFSYLMLMEMVHGQTVTMNTGVTGNYIFLNSPSHGGDWGTKEDLTGLPCSDPNNYNDRILPVIIFRYNNVTLFWKL